MISLSKLFTEVQIFFEMIRKRNAILLRFGPWSARETMSEPALSNPGVFKGQAQIPTAPGGNEFSINRNRLINISHLRCNFY
jgi:hypothetical protein